MNNSLVPQFLILDTERTQRELNWVIGTYPITQEEILSYIVERLHFEQDALENLNLLGLEIMRGSLGFEDQMGICVAVAVVNLGTQLYHELQRIGAYVHGYLPYYYEPNLHVDFATVLEKLEAKDLELF